MQAVSQFSIRHASNPLPAILTWVLAASLWCGLSHAAAQESFRVGVVDPQIVLEQSAYGKRTIAALKEHSSARQKVLASDEEDLKKLQEKLQASQDSNDADLTALQEQLQRKFQKYQQREQTFRQELAQKQTTLMTEYMGKLQVAAGTIAEQQGFTLIIDKGNEANLHIVLYASQGLDVTQDVLKEFEKLYP